LRCVIIFIMTEFLPAGWDGLKVSMPKP